MTSNLDIYRTAKLLIDQHGKDAAFHAGMMVDELLDKGDLDGRAVWRQVLAAIEELQKVAPEGPVQ